MAYNSKNIDWWLLAPILILCLISLITLYSFTIYNQNNFIFFHHQIIWIISGFIVLFLVSLIDFRSLASDYQLINIFYGLEILLLTSTLIFGREIGGNRAWLNFGSFSIQPVEFAKIILILFLSRYFADNNLNIRQNKYVLKSFLIVLPFLLLVGLQRDYGSALLLLGIWFLMLILAGAKISQILTIILIFLIIFIISWFFLLDQVHKDRIISIIFPEIDPYGISYNQSQALIAISSGGLLGKGFSKSTQAQLGFLPAAHTDFIFSAIAEEFGFIGVLTIIICFAIIFQRLAQLSLNNNNNFVKLFSMGYLIIIFLQVFINIGMNLAFLPVIGISLPFVSYGGSNLLALFLGLGIIFNIIKNTQNA